MAKKKHARFTDESWVEDTVMSCGKSDKYQDGKRPRGKRSHGKKRRP